MWRLKAFHWAQIEKYVLPSIFHFSLPANVFRYTLITCYQKYVLVDWNELQLAKQVFGISNIILIDENSFKLIKIRFWTYCV